MVVIGAGRVGQALHARSNEVGVPCTLISREEGWEALQAPPGVPIVVATRNDDLGAVIKRTPAFRRDDLVFVQNGMIRPLLRDHQASGCTRGLLYFAVTSRGGPIEPGALSPFCGSHARTMVGWLVTMGLESNDVDWAQFSALEIEKLIWNSAFGLLCQAFDQDVGTLCTERKPVVRALVGELRQIARASVGVDIPLDYLMERLVAYSLTIPTYKGSVKEWDWRNGWFVSEGERFGKLGGLHAELLGALNLPEGAGA